MRKKNSIFIAAEKKTTNKYCARTNVSIKYCLVPQNVTKSNCHMRSFDVQ